MNYLPHIVIYVSEDEALFELIKTPQSNYVAIHAKDIDHALDVINKMGIQVHIVIVDLNILHVQKLLDYIKEEAKYITVYCQTKISSGEH